MHTPEETVLIPLSNGLFAIIDRSDYELVCNAKWNYHRGYALKSQMKNGVSRKVYMHRVINGTPDGMLTDHRNGNRLDNRRSNLRTANRFQNEQNKGITKRNRSGFKGVWFCKKSNRFQAQIRFSRKKIYLGSFQTAKEASDAYSKASLEMHGEFSRTA